MSTANGVLACHDIGGPSTAGGTSKNLSACLHACMLATLLVVGLLCMSRDLFHTNGKHKVYLRKSDLSDFLHLLAGLACGGMLCSLNLRPHWVVCIWSCQGTSSHSSHWTRRYVGNDSAASLARCSWTARYTVEYHREIVLLRLRAPAPQHLECLGGSRAQSILVEATAVPSIEHVKQTFSHHREPCLPLTCAHRKKSKACSDDAGRGSPISTLSPPQTRGA